MSFILYLNDVCANISLLISDPANDSFMGPGLDLAHQQRG